MSSNRPSLDIGRIALASALAATLALSACKREAEDTAARAPEPVQRAPTNPGQQPTATKPSPTVSAVTLGTTVGADGRVATPITTFTTSDPIVVSIDTSGAATEAEITARLLYQDGQTAGEQSEAISGGGTRTTNITFTNTNGWPTGTYRAEVWVDGSMAQSREFTVR